MKFELIQQRRKEKNFKSKQVRKKLCYECNKEDYFVRNCKNENMMFRRQFNVTLKKIFEIKKSKKTNDKTKTLKINLNNDYCVINNMTKL